MFFYLFLFLIREIPRDGPDFVVTADPEQLKPEESEKEKTDSKNGNYVFFFLTKTTFLQSSYSILRDFNLAVFGLIVIPR